MNLAHDMGTAAPDPGGRSTEWKGPRTMASQTTTDVGPRRQPPFALASTLDGDTLTICIRGELDIATAGVVQEAVQSFRGECRTITYELADLIFMDSAGLRALLAPVDDLQIDRVTVTHPSRGVRRFLELRDLQGLISE